MPTDKASQTITVEAPFDRVLETIRAVETQPEWIKEILAVDLLEEYEDGSPALPASARPAPSGPTATPWPTSTPATA